VVAGRGELKLSASGVEKEVGGLELGEGDSHFRKGRL